MNKNIIIGVVAAVALLGLWKLSDLLSTPIKDGSDPTHQATNEIFTCPMHPSVKSDHIGECPQCGMDLERKIVAISSSERTATEHFSCPMHPSVRSEQFGECPMCGMDLVKKSPAAKSPSPVQKEYFTCPMHESVRAEHTGSCPVCEMTLVRKKAEIELEGNDLASLRAVSLSPTQRVMANITTEKVHRREVKNDIHAVGIISYAEPNYRLISISYPGRIERLYLTFTGQSVRKGDRVAEIYSPDAINELQKYVLAVESYEQTKSAKAPYTGPAYKILLQTRERLRRWGFTEHQLDSLKDSYQVPSLITLYSPVSGTIVKKNVEPQRYVEAGTALFEVADLSTVWILLDVYEADIRFISKHQPVHITSAAYPDEKFAGRVVFIDPVLNPESRSVRVRTEFRNPHGKLKPNMYVNATIAAPKSAGLVVPSTAILSTGKQSVAWVEVRENVFEPRIVTVGTTNDGFTVVLSGLNEGEEVAVTGGFLIDAESALIHPIDDGSEQKQSH